MKFPVHLIYFIFFVGLYGVPEPVNSQSMQYLALGDSYTIGEAVSASKNWPHQLVKLLHKEGYSFQKPQIIAKTGWRTDELMAAIREKEEELASEYDLVSLLIGVNNQYQHKAIEQYKEEFEQLLLLAIAKSKFGAKGTFVVSIPDYGVSDFAKEKGLDKASEEVAMYNAVAAGIAEMHEVAFYNITPVSQAAEGNPRLFAKDALHPSAKQYQQWVAVLYERVLAQLQAF